jgi:purine nucleoside permease
MFSARAFLAVRALVPLVALASVARAAEPIRPKFVILTTFEIGADTGDVPGELQYWVEREHLTGSIAIPGVAHPLRFNSAGVYAMVTSTRARSGVNFMALGLDPRFDLRHTYFMIAGIAGVDPLQASVGSAAWARWVVDGDNVHELGVRDAPADWPYGIMPLGASRPDEAPVPRHWDPNSKGAVLSPAEVVRQYSVPFGQVKAGDVGIEGPMAYRLSPGLVAWAYALTKDTPLPDTADAASLRGLYQGFPEGQKPPFVLLGDSLGATHFWHGPQLTLWAERWCPIFTGGDAHFVMTECEDQSISFAMYVLARAGRIDPRRYLVLRTASNYCEPPPGGPAPKSLDAEEEEGAVLAEESAYRVGSRVVHAIVDGWEKYEATPPGKGSP